MSENEKIYDNRTNVFDRINAAVFKDSNEVEEDSQIVECGIWNGIPNDLDSFLKSFHYMGFQATCLGKAIDEVNAMLNWKPSEDHLENDFCSEEKCKIWLSFTSNMISSGLREIFIFLVKNKLIDVIVTSAGGIEEDFIKCLAPTYIGDFKLQGKMLRDNGWNRIGNLIVPNNNYCLFEDWIQPILDECLCEQNKGFMWTPSGLIKKLGEKINDERSLYYWCYRNNIPVFCPGITDGSLGDNLFVHSYRKKGLIIDVVEDMKNICSLALSMKKSGMIILGGGIAKHHTCNANLMRNGADYAVYINTGQEYDGCDSGANPDEAISWGKIKSHSNPIKVHCDATIAFPLLVLSTFVPKLKTNLTQQTSLDTATG